jgi:hypothetical protein
VTQQAQNSIAKAGYLKTFLFPFRFSASSHFSFFIAWPKTSLFPFNPAQNQKGFKKFPPVGQNLSKPFCSL